MIGLLVFISKPAPSFLAASPRSGPAISLARTFVAGEKLTYQVRGELRAEDRAKGLDTWIPTNLSMSYGFTTLTKKLKSDGIAELLYRRPAFVQEEGEDFDSGPKKHVDKVNDDLIITLSPINQILDVKNLAKPTTTHRLVVAGGANKRRQSISLEQFVGELHRVSLFVGSFDTALDFNPKLPLDQVAIGDTWKQTIGYQPQTLKGDKHGKEAIQRLDYIFAYRGFETSHGKRIQRIEAQLNLDTDLGAFFNQIMETKPEDSGLEKIPMHLKATIEFDLDPQTLRTVRASAHSEGGFEIYLHEDPTVAAAEEKFRGTTTETLVSRQVSPGG